MHRRTQNDLTSTVRRRPLAASILAVLTVLSVAGMQGAAAASQAPLTWTKGTTTVGAMGVTESVASIMHRQRATDRSVSPQIIPKPEHTSDRSSLPQNPNSPVV